MLPLVVFRFAGLKKAARCTRTHTHTYTHHTLVTRISPAVQILLGLETFEVRCAEARGGGRLPEVGFLGVGGGGRTLNSFYGNE